MLRDPGGAERWRKDVEIEARENPRKWMSLGSSDGWGSGDWDRKGDNLRQCGAWKFLKPMGCWPMTSRMMHREHESKRRLILLDSVNGRPLPLEH
jgi:hypothetical protein